MLFQEKWTNGYYEHFTNAPLVWQDMGMYVYA
jgi:hypothetical protein